MGKYPRLHDNEGIELRPHPRIKNAFELLNFMCCDCGLTHTISFAVEKNGNLGVALRRNKRATAAARRKSKHA